MDIVPDEPVLKVVNKFLVVGVELGTEPGQARVVLFVVGPVTWRSSGKKPGENSRPPKNSAGAWEK